MVPSSMEVPILYLTLLNDSFFDRKPIDDEPVSRNSVTEMSTTAGPSQYASGIDLISASASLERGLMTHLKCSG